MLEKLARQGGLTPLQKSAHGRVAFEPDRHVVGASRLVVGARPRQQLGARRPVGLVFGEPGVAGDRFKAASPASAPFASASATARLIATTGEPVSASSAS